jgi:hypothetical protein
MQEYSFIPGIGMETDEFWAACREAAVTHGMDSVLAYMLMMVERARGRMKLTRETLAALGENIAFFPGVITWFDRINEIGEQAGVRVEHYIISSGLKEIVEGSPIGDRFRAVFAASFCYDSEGNAMWPATAVNYTGKTQYLYRINKGILDVSNDRDLNAYTPDYMRPIPFSHMIYVGDGLTDVPCMKTTRSKGGYAIAVYRQGNSDIADDLLLQNRADFAVPADYTEGSVMEQTVTTLLRKLRAEHDLIDIHKRHMRQADRRRNATPRAGSLPVRGVNVTEDAE